MGFFEYSYMRAVWSAAMSVLVPISGLYLKDEYLPYQSALWG